MRVYLTPEQFSDMTEGDTVTADRLRRASLQVEDALTGVVYMTDPSGIPSKPDTLLAVQWAIIAQAKALKLLDQHTQATANFGGTLKSANIGSVSYGIEPSKLPVDVDASSGRLVYESWLYLKAAGLLPTAVAYG